MKKILTIVVVCFCACAVFAGPHGGPRGGRYYRGGCGGPPNSGVWLAAGITSIVANGLNIIGSLVTPVVAAQVVPVAPAVVPTTPVVPVVPQPVVVPQQPIVPVVTPPVPPVYPAAPVVTPPVYPYPQMYPPAYGGYGYPPPVVPGYRPYINKGYYPLMY